MVLDTKGWKQPNLQTLKFGSTQRNNIFLPDFNKLPYSLRSQGDNVEIDRMIERLEVWHDIRLKVGLRWEKGDDGGTEYNKKYSTEFTVHKASDFLLTQI